MIGMNVSAAAERIGLVPARRFVIDEPPLVPRGVRGKDRRGDLVELYIRRGAVPFTGESQWQFEQFSDKTVIGVARESADRWTVTGEVMLVRAMGAWRAPAPSFKEGPTPSSRSLRRDRRAR